MTQLDLYAEYWAHYYAENNIVDEVEDDEFDLDEVVRQIEEEAEGTASYDDEWEEIDLDAVDGPPGDEVEPNGE